MSLHMLDTNMVSHALRHHPEVLRKLAEMPADQLCISCITEGELRFGLELDPKNMKLRATIEGFLLRLNILPWNGGAAGAYARARASLHRAGRRIGPVDLLIAAHAISLDAVIVTNDRAFRQIPGLLVEDWTSPSE